MNFAPVASPSASMPMVAGWGIRLSATLSGFFFAASTTCLDALDRAILPHEDAGIVDVGPAEIDEVLREFVVRLLGRIHDHFRTHVAEQQVVAVVLALLHEQRVADLAGGAGLEFVFERLVVEQLRPDHRRARQALCPAALAGRNHHAEMRDGYAACAGAACRDKRQAGAAATPPQNDRRVRIGSLFIIVSLPDVLLGSRSCRPQLKPILSCHGTPRKLPKGRIRGPARSLDSKAFKLELRISQAGRRARRQSPVQCSISASVRLTPDRAGILLQ